MQNSKNGSFFLFIVTDKVGFGAISSTCVVYIKTIIIHLDISESGGYLAHLNEELLNYEWHLNIEED